jgi:hypothetical protein
MDEFVVITGLSAAGRSLAADDLEDLGWFVIDLGPVGRGGQPGSRTATAPRSVAVRMSRPVPWASRVAARGTSMPCQKLMLANRHVAGSAAKR